MHKKLIVERKKITIISRKTEHFFDQFEANMTFFFYEK